MHVEERAVSVSLHVLVAVCRGCACACGGKWLGCVHASLSKWLNSGKPHCGKSNRTDGHAEGQTDRQTWGIGNQRSAPSDHILAFHYSAQHEPGLPPILLGQYCNALLMVAPSPSALHVTLLLSLKGEGKEGWREGDTQTHLWVSLKGTAVQKTLHPKIKVPQWF